MISTLTPLFDRETGKVIQELDLYRDENRLWYRAPGILNPAGNLALHLTGNLNHFIGAVLGKTGYVRQRDLEFSQTGIDRKVLISDLEKTRQMVNSVLSSLPGRLMTEPYPLEKHGETVTHDHMLLHLLTHLSYHLGQINYHRRLTDQGII